MTLKVFEDNSLVRQALEGPGEGRVLVVDGGGSLRCALVGGMLGQLALDNDWAGIVVYGCVRDTEELNGMALGIRALQAHPRKSHKRGVGDSGLTVRFAGLTVRPGDWIYADEDGLLVSTAAVHAD
jgi:regulator of ribonuclease activity A